MVKEALSPKSSFYFLFSERLMGPMRYTLERQKRSGVYVILKDVVAGSITVFYTAAQHYQNGHANKSHPILHDSAINLLIAHYHGGNNIIVAPGNRFSDTRVQNRLSARIISPEYHT